MFWNYHILGAIVTFSTQRALSRRNSIIETLNLVNGDSAGFALPIATMANRAIGVGAYTPAPNALVDTILKI